MILWEQRVPIPARLDLLAVLAAAAQHGTGLRIFLSVHSVVAIVTCPLPLRNVVGLAAANLLVSRVRSAPGKR